MKSPRNYISSLQLHRRLLAHGKASALPWRHPPLSPGVLCAVSRGHDVLTGDERAAAPVLLATLAVQVDGGHPGPLTGPRHVPADHTELRSLRHAARWTQQDRSGQVRAIPHGTAEPEAHRTLDTTGQIRSGQVRAIPHGTAGPEAHRTLDTTGQVRSGHSYTT